MSRRHAEGSEPDGFGDERSQEGPPAGSRHQPPNPDDLRRHPPRSDTCVAMRGLLRDFCDGDLGAAERAALEEHVHVCRDCAVALARAEREAMLIERAFDEDRAVRGSADTAFTRRVMTEISAMLFEEQDAPPQFTGRVMERVRIEWRRVPLWRRAWLRLGAARAAVLAAGLIGVGLVLWHEASLPREGRTHDAAVAVVASRGASVAGREVGGAPRALRAGDTLTAGDVLRVEVQGEVECLLPDTGADVGGGVRFVLFGGGRALVESAQGDMVLLDGAVRVDAARAWSLGLADGTAIAFESGGRYDASVQSVRRFDRAVGGSPLQLRVEVFGGQARVRRAGIERAVIAAGKVAHVGDLDVVLEDAPRLDPLARVVASTDASDADRARAASLAVQHSGRVVDATSGRGVAGAQVRLASGLDPLDPLLTDAEGWFHYRLATESVPYLTVSVVPPVAASIDFAAYGPEPLATEELATGRPLTIALLPDSGMRGVVRTSQGKPIADAHVTACVVDELFALVDRLDDRMALSQVDGSFAVRGLPGALQAHQSLAILVESDGRPRVACAVRRGMGADALLDVVVPDGAIAALSDLPAGQVVEVVQEIEGLPLGAISDAFRVTSDASGHATLSDVGPGELWLRDRGADGGLRRLAADADGRLVASSARAPQRLARQFDRMGARERGSFDGGALLAMASLGNRFERCRAVTASVPTATRLMFRDAPTAEQGSTRVFLELATGEVAFVGIWDGVSELPFVPPEERPFRIVALGSDGSFGSLPSEAFDSGATAIALEASGGTDPSDGDFGAVTGECMFELLDGPFAGQRFWRVVDFARGIAADKLIPGTYRVTLPDGRRASCTVPTGALGKLTPVAASR